MSFQCLSISHAPLALRERLSLTADQQTAWLQQVAGVEAAVLSTCNRLELYVYAEANIDGLWEHLLAQKHIHPSEVSRFTTRYQQYEAACHLFQVSASLHSMVLGEAQILGQVTQAFEQARRAGAARHHLSLLFRSAIHAAKRVHTETAVGAGQVSVSSLAVKQVNALLRSTPPILVIGAGEMGQAVLKNLRHCTNITLVSRTYETARQVAALYGVKASPITHLHTLLSQARVIFTASNAPAYLLSPADLSPSVQGGRELTLVDIAMPRNVDPRVRRLPGVSLFDLDDLQKIVEKNKEERQKAAAQARHILEDELTRFRSEYEGRAAVPTIHQIRQQVEQIRQQELTRILNRLPDEQQQELRLLFEEFSHRLMNKVLHQPTLSLKTSGALFHAVARDLFGLKDEP